MISGQKKEQGLAWPLWLMLCLYGLFAMTDARSVFALPWMIGRSDILSWWVYSSRWSLGGGLLLLAVASVASITYARTQEPKGRRWITIAFAVIALTCLFMSGRARVEVRASDFRVSWEDPSRADVIYRVEHASQIDVSCSTGGRRRRNEIYPSINVRFFDGAVIELTPLLNRSHNRSQQRHGLTMLERIDLFLSPRNNRYAATYYPIVDYCVERASLRFPRRDRPRVVRLFRD